jgi:hypothetical protein
MFLFRDERDRPTVQSSMKSGILGGVGAGRGATAKAPLILGGGVFGAMHGCIVAVDELFLS